MQTRLCRPVRAVILFAVPAAVAGVLFWIGHTHMATVVLTIGGVFLISGLFIPPVFNALERLNQTLGWGVAVALTWILLTPVYWLIFTPGRIVLRLSRRDPMRRAWPTREPTYWTPHPPVRDPGQYKKQF